jgi:hypothetical protein
MFYDSLLGIINGPSRVKSIEKYIRIMDQKDFPIHILNEAKGEMKDQYLSIEKSKMILNWSPQL